MRKTGAVPAIVCAAVLMVNLAGCAAGNTGPDKSAEPSSPEAAVENEASVEEKEAETAPSEEPDEDSSEPSVFTEDEEAVYEQAITGDGIVNTFIGERFSDKKVTDEESALECVNGMIERIGGDSTTELIAEYVRPNDRGMKVLTFSQRAGQLMVYGATVKLILDKDDMPIGLVSSILPDVRIRKIDEWAVDEGGAEKIVLDRLKASASKETLVEGATEQAIIPMPDVREHFVCTWVVFTKKINKDRDDQTYTAHYIRADGEYLYSMPVSEPGNEESEKGESAKAAFDFDAYEPGELDINVEARDGTKKLTVPVLDDKATGKRYLADAKRKILCADQAKYEYEGKIEPLEIQDGVDPTDAHTYDTFIRVWDYYDQLGWTGPDGEGTPTLMLMDWRDTDGTPIDNACYVTAEKGFQVFGWSRVRDYGKCTDLIAHEFTHCLTQKVMTYNLYKNDPGAINEAFSDIMGNVIEMRLDGEDGAWIIGEGMGKPFRNMAKPHEHLQPEYAWDVYYLPKPGEAIPDNDQGGVHTNLSLLSMISYKLFEAGMSPRDQGYFWINTAFIMSPQNDYPMLSELLPWVMRELGYDRYLDALNTAMEETGIAVTKDPGTIPDGYGALKFDLSPLKEAADDGLLLMGFIKAPEIDISNKLDTWPQAGTTAVREILEPGEYYVVLTVIKEDGSARKSTLLGKDGWTILKKGDQDTIRADGATVSVFPGETKELTYEGFDSAVSEIKKALE